MRVWNVVGLLSLWASFSMAAGLPGPVEDTQFPTPETNPILLGRDLFFDPILSGNQNISCAVCHHPEYGTSDGTSFSIGEGGKGLGRNRHVDDASRGVFLSARNAPVLYNLGAWEFTRMFYDGRVTHDPTSGAGAQLPDGLKTDRPPSSALAAQVLVHLIDQNGMAGQQGENDIANSLANDQSAGANIAWQMIANRVESIPEYRRRFSVIPGADQSIDITDIAQAIAAYIAFEFRSSDSPFDEYLAGNTYVMNNTQLQGMSLFYGKAKCDACHSGPFQTDHAFHSLGLPQLGPGKNHGPEYADHGRGAITGKPEDNYRFRTPTLRNIFLSAPYGHSGAYNNLKDMIRHHLDPETGLAEYVRAEKTTLPNVVQTQKYDRAMADYDEVLRIFEAITIAPVTLADAEIDALVAFLFTLTDPISVRGGRFGPPTRVPSGLPVEQVPESPI